MLRDPAIHIKRSDLLKLCNEEGITFPDDFVDRLFTESTKHNLRNRVLITTTAKAAVKVARTTATKHVIVAQFNRVYNSVMIEHHYKTVTIRKGTKPYLTMKEVATNAYEFRDAFQIGSLEESFKYYIDLGMKVLGKNFSIYSMKGADNKIRIKYTNLMLVFDDLDPQGTARMAEAWHTSLKSFHGLEMEINDDQFVAIVLARQMADKVSAKYQDWMDAQFDRWTYLSAMPEFSQLHGDKSIMAYTQYMSGKKNEFKNEDERKHFEAVKHEKKVPIKEVKRKRGSRKA